VNFKKGSLVLILGWSVQLLAGYVLNRFLARTFDLGAFGTYGLIMTLLLWVEIFVITGLPTAVQKFVPSHGRNAASILSAAARLEFAMALVLSVGLFAAAPFLASVFSRPDAATVFRLAFLNLPFYGFFHLFAAYQNGLRKFGRQALCIGAYGLFKLGCVAAAVSLDPSLIAAFTGNLFGSTASLVLAFGFSGRSVWMRPSHERELIRFAAPALAYSLMIQLLLSADLWMVDYHLGGEAGGRYFAAANVARIPFYLLSGLTATVLPTLSHALTEGVMTRVRGLIRGAVRFLALLVAPAAMLLIVFSPRVLSLLFSDAFVPAAGTLRILVPAMSGLAFFTLFLTVINADGRPATSFGIAAATSVLDVALNLLWVPSLGGRGAALATLAAVSAGLCWGAADVLFRFRVRPPWRSLMKIFVAACGLAACAAWIPSQGLWFVLSTAAALAAYGALLMGFGEIKRDDWKALFSKKAGPEPMPGPPGAVSP
jgi:O-antigen/teichoic acid export membrane protein